MKWQAISAMAMALAAMAASAGADPTVNTHFLTRISASVTPSPAAVMITHPDWVDKPDGDDLADDYPPLPYELGLGGRVFVECAVAATGLLYDCKVESETPTGLGFADAALTMTKKFRMKPETVDGLPVSGATVMVPLVLSAAPDRPDKWEPPATPPSPEALAAARALVDAENLQLAATAWLHGKISSLARDVDTETPEAANAIAALNHAADIVAPGLVEDSVRWAAGRLSIDEMKARLIAWQASPGLTPDKDLWWSGDEVDGYASSPSDAAWTRTVKLARAAFCKTTLCGQTAGGNGGKAPQP